MPSLQKETAGGECPLIAFHPQPIDQQLQEITERVQKLKPRVDIVTMKTFALLQRLPNSGELLDLMLKARDAPMKPAQGTQQERLQKMRDALAEIEAKLPSIENALSQLTETPTSIVNIYVQNLVREAVQEELKK